MEKAYNLHQEKLKIYIEITHLANPYPNTIVRELN